MSIISDALKKVEGNSAAPSKKKQEGAQVEVMRASSPPSSPPLFSVWSIVLSTIMVLTAAILLFVTWYTNRARQGESVATTDPIASPVKVTPVSEIEMPAEATASVPEPVAEPVPEPAPEPEPVTKREVKPAEPVPEPKPLSATRPPAEPKPEKALPTAAPAAKTPPQPAEKPVLPALDSPQGDEVTPRKVEVRKRDELVLTGVVYTPRVRMAHINGKILPEGAEIEGYRIVTVSRESVRLSKDDKFYILRLKR